MISIPVQRLIVRGREGCGKEPNKQAGFLENLLRSSRMRERKNLRVLLFGF